jgi:hypothetical protein
VTPDRFPGCHSSGYPAARDSPAIAFGVLTILWHHGRAREEGLKCQIHEAEEKHPASKPGDIHKRSIHLWEGFGCRPDYFLAAVKDKLPLGELIVPVI